MASPSAQTPFFGLDRSKLPHRFSPDYVPEPGPVDREEAFGLVAEIVGLPNGSMSEVLERVRLLTNAASAP